MANNEMPKSFQGGVNVLRVPNTLQFLFSLESNNHPLLHVTQADYTQASSLLNKFLTDKLDKGTVEEMWQVNDKGLEFTHILKTRNNGSYTFSLVDLSRPVNPKLIGRVDLADLPVHSSAFKPYDNFENSDFAVNHHLDIESRNFTNFNPRLEPGVQNPHLKLTFLLMFTLFDAAKHENFVFISNSNQIAEQTKQVEMMDEVIDVVAGNKKYEFGNMSNKSYIIDPMDFGLFKEKLSI